MACHVCRMNAPHRTRYVLCDPCMTRLSIERSYAKALEGQNAHFASQVSELVDALAHERDRARRVARVFWRVRNAEGRCEIRDSRFAALMCAKWWIREGGKVYRVTVRRKVKA